MTARLAFTVWTVKELVAALAIVAAAGAYTHDVIVTIGVVLAAIVSAAGGIAAARTARANRATADEMRDTAALTADELAELRRMLDRRRTERRASPAALEDLT